MTKGQKRGEESPHSKFTESEIIEIIEKAINGEPQKAIVEQYGITQSYLSRLLKRQNWCCIKHPSNRCKRWRAYLAQTHWQGVKRNDWYISESLRLFDESFTKDLKNKIKQKYS